MTTRAPVIVFAVSLGVIQVTRQPEAARRVRSFCPSACRVPLYRPWETITRMRVLPGPLMGNSAPREETTSALAIPAAGLVLLALAVLFAEAAVARRFGVLRRLRLDS
jgi:hypothetical protein